MIQTIFRKRVKSGFTIVPNEVVRDDRLSAKARGIFILILSQPDDWIVNLEWIKGQVKEGRDAIAKVMKELMACGYCRKINVRDERCNLVRTVWQFKDFRDAGFPSSGKPEAGKTDTTNTMVTNTMVTKEPLGAFQPERDFPVDEDDMMENIEREIGYTLTGQADTIARNFHSDMEKAGWTIKGTTVRDWLKVLSARIERQTGENILSRYENEDVAF